MNVPFRERLTCSVTEAQAYTGLGNTTIWKLISSGRLKTAKVNATPAPGRGKVLIDVPSLLAVVTGEDSRMPPREPA